MDDVVFFFEQRTAYEVRISDWSSDVCSSDLQLDLEQLRPVFAGDEQAFASGVPRNAIEYIVDGIGQLADVEQSAEVDPAHDLAAGRQEARRVGKACARPCQTRGSPIREKKKP